MIIRGRVLTDEIWIKPWIFGSTALMYIIYSAFYFYAHYKVNNQSKLYSEYFANIETRCPGVTASDEKYFFYDHSNLDCGLITVFLGVYFGALMRHRDHGMVRRDYSHH